MPCYPDNMTCWHVLAVPNEKKGAREGEKCQGTVCAVPERSIWRLVCLRNILRNAIRGIVSCTSIALIEQRQGVARFNMTNRIPEASQTNCHPIPEGVEEIAVPILEPVHSETSPPPFSFSSFFFKQRYPHLEGSITTGREAEGAKRR